MSSTSGVGMPPSSGTARGPTLPASSSGTPTPPCQPGLCGAPSGLTRFEPPGGPGVREEEVGGGPGGKIFHFFVSTVQKSTQN